MECHFLTFNTLPIDCLKHLFGEMKSSRRGSYGAFNLGIDGLISGFVALLRFPVQIGRNRQFPHFLQNLSKSDIRIVPFQIHPMAVTHHLPTGCGQRKLFALDGKVTLQSTFLPFLQVSNHTKPRAMAGQLEHQFIICGIGRFKQEHLDEGSRLFSEVHSGLNHLRVIEYHQSPFGKIVRQIIE